MFDEQPDGDLHGECAAEIHRLQALSNETLDFLAMMFDAYEEGPDCYEDPEDCSGHIGKAIHLDDDAFQRIADILNEHRPRNTAVSPAPTFADGMTAEDDRRFLEATSGLDSYELPRCFRCGHLLHAGDCVNVAPYNMGKDDKNQAPERTELENLEAENFAWRTKLGIRGYEIRIADLEKRIKDLEAECMAYKSSGL